MNLFSGLVIAVYVLILFKYIKDTEYTKMLGLTLVTALIICQLKNSNLEGLTNNSNKSNSNKSNSNKPTSESVAIDKRDGKMPKTQLIKQKEAKITPLDLKYKIGPYDGLCLSDEEDLNKLIGDNKLMSYLGVQGPIQNVGSDNSYLTGPTVDGDEDSPQRLFMFANNVTSLNCCPSTYSSSTGCVCSTKKQNDFINRRGFNRTGQGQF